MLGQLTPNIQKGFKIKIKNVLCYFEHISRKYIKNINIKFFLFFERSEMMYI